MSARTSLAALREELRAAEGERRFAGLVRRLEADPRAGAQALAAWGRRRLSRRAAERRRLRRLLLRRDRLVAAGATRVAGVDEVGMGPLAGPVVAAAVILPRRPELPGLNDSKQLTPAARETLAAAIHAQALQVAVAEVDAAEIDRINIYRAGLAAMSRAVRALAPAADHLLIDARTLAEIPVRQTPLVGGDARDASIAAASIVAKVHRDRLMEHYAQHYPGYGFEGHKGYATAAHRAALRRLGPSPIHRRSFAPCSAGGDAPREHRGRPESRGAPRRPQLPLRP